MINIDYTWVRESIESSRLVESVHNVCKHLHHTNVHTGTHTRYGLCLQTDHNIQTSSIKENIMYTIFQEAFTIHFFFRMTTADDRKIVVGRATYRKHLYYMIPARAMFFRRNMLLCWHPAARALVRACLFVCVCVRGFAYVKNNCALRLNFLNTNALMDATHTHNISTVVTYWLPMSLCTIILSLDTPLSVSFVNYPSTSSSTESHVAVSTS
jgi:hypothetical protein